MRPKLIIVGALFVVACEPGLGNPTSLVTLTRVLAVRGTPPEAKPGVMVHFDLLVASTNGTVASPPANWSFCLSPKPPAENNIVATTCLLDSAQSSIVGPAATDDDSLPMTACQFFGPDVPSAAPGQLPKRPADPDITGGYFQPIRVKLAGVAIDGAAAFGLERVTCALGSAPVDISQTFAKSYKANNNPIIEGVTGTISGGAPIALASPTMAPSSISVPHGGKLDLAATWTADSPESFPVYDVASLSLVTQRESLRLSWFATSGKFAHDVTGRAETDQALDTDNVWTAPGSAGTAHLWVVLRDSRGGVDFAAFDVMVQ